LPRVVEKFHSMNILIIEDEPEIRNSLRDLLEINGHRVLAADDGTEGVRLAETHPDLILCDVAMPAKDGYEVLTTLRLLPRCRDIPFIFVTGRVDRAAQRQGMALGADDYLTKPFTERDLLDAIAARVRRQQPSRERIDRLLAERRATVNAPWSHELMTPLCGILVGIELIEMDADIITPAELKIPLGLIRTGAERQHSLSKKLALYYELERMKAASDRGASYCHDVAGAINAGARRAASSEHRVSDLLVRCEGGAVLLDDEHLRVAVAELTGNAFRFSQPGQPVRVSGTHRGARYRIEVVDQGVGMTEEERGQVDAFKQFGRKEREQQGLGLGLAIVRSAAELAGGFFELRPGAGSQGLKAILELPCN
jgi:two-component system sensor histidine kinase/response regulator